DIAFDGRIFRTILTRGADQDLTGRARLCIEGDRIGNGRMCALQITQLDYLVPHETRVAIRNQQVALTWLHRYLRQQISDLGAGRENRKCGRDSRAVLELHARFRNLDDARAKEKVT